MIPLKLRLKNFMCYRDVPDPLPLEGVHVACICGDNGHGKSALLDAMTWALWGKARGRSVDDLVHVGESDMEVELEFTNGQDAYRVIRKRKSGKGPGSGASVLELQISSDADGAAFRAITANTIAETQAKIIDILRLGYDTFVNSAFLRQGRADEFTLRTPTERKEVLADILQLSYYDKLEQLARQKSRDREQEAGNLRHSLSEIEREVGQRPDLESSLALSEADAQSLESEEATQRRAVQALSEEKVRMEASAEELEALRDRLKGLEDDLGRARGEGERFRARVAGYATLLDDAESLEERYNRFQRAAETAQRMADALREHSRLSGERNRLERTLESARTQLKGELERLGFETRTLAEKVERVAAAEEELVQASVRLAALDETFQELAEQTSAQEEMSVEVRGRESENERLLAEMKDLRKKVDLLGQGVSECPTCGTSLAEAGIEHVKSALTAEGLRRRDAYNANSQRIADLTAKRDRDRAATQQTQTEAEKERTALRARVAVLERDISEGEAASQRLPPLREQESRLSRTLHQASFEPETRKQLAEIVRQLESLDYDEEAHRVASQEKASLQGADVQWLKLQEARGLIQEAREDLQRAESRQAELISRIEQEQRKRTELEALAGRLPQISARLKVQEQSLTALQKKLQDARDRVAGLRERLKAIHALEERGEVQRAQLGRAAREKGSYDELARAFGKGGVQALIIETALPEIEDEANRLLSRMTDNRMHVKIETQKEKKSGGSIETLDINIADELGSRAYEMFSGGEAFRINFALRVAISKLLTRRAGAPLRILFIDEGFGTQDGAGREKLLDAIYSIQEDFDRIIVITHIDELKEAFPVRILVEKTAQGSTFSVN